MKKYTESEWRKKVDTWFNFKNVITIGIYLMVLLVVSKDFFVNGNLFNIWQLLAMLCVVSWIGTFIVTIMNYYKPLELDSAFKKSKL